MIYLTTGANGSFKTCNTLWDVRQQQIKENRPVYFHGFKAGPKLTDEFGWKPFDPKKWQDLPDGSICIFDECQNEFPVRGKGEVPDYINAIAQFRRARGFDFWLITPHPMLIDVFIRRLIDNPSWHRHNKRVAGANMISQLKWNSVKADCEKPGSGESGEVTMVPARKEVFEWYESASLHTGKKKIPRGVWVVLAVLAVVPMLGYYAVQKLSNPAPTMAAKIEAAKKTDAAPGAPIAAVQRSRPAGGGGNEPLTLAEYVAARSPRIEGLQFTAPAYDELTKPQNVPYPAACLQGRSPRTGKTDCTCFTQQGTMLATPADICRQIVAQGFFMEWHKPEKQGAQAAFKPVGLPEPAPEGVSAAQAAHDGEMIAIARHGKAGGKP